MKILLTSLVALVTVGTSYQTGLSSSISSDPPASFSPDAPLLSFSRLPVGHILLVRYRTTGCEHYFDVEFRFDGGSPLMVTATHIETKWDAEAGQKVETGRVPIGSMALSGDDAKDLDSVIAFYRTRPEGACVVIDRISIRHLFRGEVVAAERYVDRSCILLDIAEGDELEQDELEQDELEEDELEEEIIPPLTFWDLLQRFRNQWPDEMIGG